MARKPSPTATQAPPKCPVCDKTNSTIIHTGIREDPTRSVYLCQTCGMQFILPPYDDLKRYYQEEYRQTHSIAPGRCLTSQEQFDMMSPLMNVRDKVFREYVPKGAKVLEIGAASGYFLGRINDDYSCYASDFNATDMTFVGEKLGIPTDTEDIDTCFPGEKFTCIVACHILEHVKDPIAWLRKAKERLVGGGWLYLEVPNVDNVLLAMYDIPNFKNFFYRDAHLTYWSMNNLGAALNQLGFEARIQLKQDYSLFNHIWWMIQGEPMPTAQVAQEPLLPLHKEHPASGLVNRFFARWDREYRVLLDTMKACDVLIGIGRKREI